MRKFISIFLFIFSNFILTLVAGDSPDDAFKQAETLWQNKQWESAIQSYEAFLEKSTNKENYAKAYSRIAQFLESSNRFDEALAYYHKALNHADSFFTEELQIDIANIYTRLHRFEEASKIYQKIMSTTTRWNIFKTANTNLKAMCRIRATEIQKNNKNKPCGQKCLELILSLNGIPFEHGLITDNTSDNKINNFYSLATLQESLKKHGVKSTGIRILDKNPKIIIPPSIIHIQGNHFILLKGVSKNRCYFIDPQIPESEKVLPVEEFKEIWSGAALCLGNELSKNTNILQLTPDEMKSIVGGHHPVGNPSSNLGGSENNDNTKFYDPASIWVNTSNLNLVLQDIDGVWKTMGDYLVLMRTYNADDPNKGMFGNSWRFRYEETLLEQTNGDVIFTRGDGKQDLFTSQGDGNFTPPVGVFDKLHKETDGSFTLEIKRNKEKHLFDVIGHLIAILDRNSNRIDINWGTNGITNIIIHYGDGSTSQISFSYDANGYCLRMILPDGRFAQFNYDSAGNLINSTDLIGNQTLYTYDTNGYILSVTTPRGTSYVEYQTAWWNSNIFIVKKITDPLGSETLFDLPALMTSITDPLGNVWQYTSQETTGFITEEVNPPGAKILYDYDAQGNLIKVTDPLNRSIQFEYDANGNITRIIDGAGSSVALTYNGADNLITATDPLSHKVQFEYDSKSNLTKIIDSKNQEVLFTYDQFGQLIQLQNSRGKKTIFSYDEKGNLISINSPANFMTKYIYDSSNRIISLTKPDNVTISFQYDNFDRVTKMTYPDGAVNYEYDFTLLKRITAKDGRQMTFDYDAFNRLTTYQDLNGFIIKYAYDKAHNRTSLIYPGDKVVQYEYDSAKRLVSVIDWLGNKATYSSDLSGDLIETNLPNGTKTLYEYDTLGRLISLRNIGVNGNPLPEFYYGLDEIGNRIAIATRGYTSLSLPELSLAYTYDSDDRILTAGNKTFENDANGNIIKEIGPSGTTTYTYDYNNVLKQVNAPSQTYRYEYDPLGTRISREIGSNKTLFGVDINQYLPSVLFRADIDKQTIDYFVYGLGVAWRIDAQTNNSYYYYFDGLGSTVAITDYKGDMVELDVYGPFGEPKSLQSQDWNCYRYIGQFGIIDEGNNIYFVRTRYYKADIGRFLNKDIIGYWGGLNMYTYVRNSPINLVDPFGLTGVEDPLRNLGINITRNAFFPNLRNIGISAIVGTLSGFAAGFLSCNPLVGWEVGFFAGTTTLTFLTAIGVINSYFQGVEDIWNRNEYMLRRLRFGP